MNYLLGIAGLNMALAVMLGAFGAHGLKAKLSAEMMSVYGTAVQYHFYHALGLILVVVLLQQAPHTLLKYAAYFLMLGTVFFSGSLYLLSVTSTKWLGMITPIGGLFFIVAWLQVAYVGFRA